MNQARVNKALLQIRGTCWHRGPAGILFTRDEHFARGKMSRVSAGLLPFKRVGDELEVFLVHPGGPFWRNKDLGSWTIAKGEVRDDEDALHCARREFEEETGQKATGDFISLGEVRQAGRKIVK